MIEYLNLSLNEVLDKNQIKIIIFDFDETMYTSYNIKQYYINFIKKTLNDLAKMSEKQALIEMEKYGFLDDGESRISFGKNCEKFGVTKEQWNEYRIENFFEIDYENAITADSLTFEKLAKTKKLFIVSNEILENLLYKAEKMNIDLKPFKKIYAPTKKQVLDYSSNKKEIYNLILKTESCNANEILVVGDRYNVDIKPLIELGGNGVLVKNSKEIDDYFKNW